MYKSRALFSSLVDYDAADLFCLVTDGRVEGIKNEGWTGLALSDLDAPLSLRIQEKYNGDKLRWGLKPILLRYLLDQGYKRVIYVDNDIYFYSSPLPILEELKKNSVLLTPHDYLADPTKDQIWLEATFRIGLFNAGFIGVNSNGADALDWWASCCAYNIKKASWRGLFDDQKYLDLIPVLFEDVKLYKNVGCNVAFWNLHSREIQIHSDGTYLTNGIPLIFVHFTKGTLRKFNDKGFLGLAKVGEAYLATLKKFNPSFKPDQLTKRSIREYLDVLRHLWWNLQRLLER